MRLSALTVAAVLALLLAEGALRALRHVRVSTAQPTADWEQIFSFSALRHHRLNANMQFRHREPEFDYLWANNALGMRDRERALEKSAATRRILFLGDSFVQGYGVPLEQSMVALLEESLNRAAGRPAVEIFNAGVFGYSPLLEYLYLEELMPSVQPDVVMIGLFLGNDVGDDNFYQSQLLAPPADGSVRFSDRQWPWTAMDEAIAATDSPEAHRRSRWMIRLRAHLARSLLWRTAEQAFEAHRARREYKAQMAARESFTATHRDDIRFNLAAVCYPQAEPALRAAYWQPTKLYLRKTAEICFTRGVPLILVVFPPLDLLSEAARFSEPYDIMDELGRELSVPVVHLLDGFRAHASDELIYPMDGHWNPRGHRVAATILEQELRRMDLLSLQ